MGRQADSDENRQDLRNEGKRRFLNLRQRLDERDDEANDHGSANRGACRDQNSPDRRLDNIECIGFIHRLATSYCRWRSSPASAGLRCRSRCPSPDLQVSPLSPVLSSPSGLGGESAIVTPACTRILSPSFVVAMMPSE